MHIIFWVTTFIFLAISLVFVLPWLRSLTMMLMISVTVVAVSYGLYGLWGSSGYLRHYYSLAAEASRAKHIELRLLLAEFRKEEFRLRARLEKDPRDQDAEWRLLDVLAIKALHDQEYLQAIQYWESAFVKIPNNKVMETEKKRIKEIIEVVRKSIR
jgi:cytochrome c-type biogenesis protein CcmH/NrfG